MYQQDSYTGLKAYGGAGQIQRPRRRRLNIYSPILCVIIPWIVFTVVFGSLSFSVRYYKPLACYGVVLGCLAGVSLMIFSAYNNHVQRITGSPSSGPTWLSFLAASTALAWGLGVYAGETTYARNMSNYYHMNDLHTYSDIRTDSIQGESVMDAGIAEFAKGTYLDLSKSGGFRNQDLYCVAPIVFGNTTLSVYDFWVAARDCCGDDGTSKGKFHCEGYNNPKASSGLRVVSDAELRYYRMAVQQVEGAHHIRAAHPIFFKWVVNAAAIVEGWRDDATSIFYWAIMGHLAFQMVLVALVGFVFAHLPMVV